jgi:hypothetical protein
MHWQRRVGHRQATEWVTPSKLSSRLLRKFQSTIHTAYVSYWPEGSYNHKTGDWRDFATYASYELAQGVTAPAGKPGSRAPEGPRAGGNHVS